MKASESGQRAKHIPPYSSRKRWPRAIRDRMKEIQQCKQGGDWARASWLEYTLRNAWWGYNKYVK